MKNILILSSSPPKGCNTDLLCDAFAKGAKVSCCCLLGSMEVLESIR